MRLCLAIPLLAAGLFGQEPTPPAQPAPTPPEVAAAPPQGEQPESEYGGPAILTRGGTSSLSHNSELARIRPFLAVTGAYDTGLGAAKVDPEGRLNYSDTYGVMGTFGLTGFHEWKTSVLDLDYHGSVTRYTGNSLYNSFDNSLMLSYQRQLSPHVSVQLSEAGARYTRAFGLSIGQMLGTGFLNYDPAVSGLVANDLFDSPTWASISSGILTYQRTARTSFSFGGTGYIVRRSSTALIGSDGYTATGDWAYRLSRFQTVGVSYDFGHFGFQNMYGQSDMHGVFLNYSVRIGRRWELALAGGGYRLESQRLISVALDPVVAALLGQGVGIERFYAVTYTPSYRAHLTRAFRRASLTMGYDRTVMPGNGVYLTSTYQNGNAGFTYTGIRHLALQAGASYGQYSSFTQHVGKYQAVAGSAGFSSRLSRWISLVGRIDGRRYEIAGTQTNHVYYRASLGFAFAPSDYPLPIW